MRFLFITLLALAVSCTNVSEEDKNKGMLTGNWLVLDAGYILDKQSLRELYRQVQDSLELKRSLKLLTFSGDGSFCQMDHLQQKGKWVITPYKEVYMVEGGEGFDNFKGEQPTLENGMLKLTEYILIDEERVKLEWNLKKVDAPALYGEENNSWRQKPLKTESEAELRKRLSVMLAYYSGYFTLVTKETNYFMPVRVPLPFRYYQHAMGMKSFSEESAFTDLFYNIDQSKTAYYLLESAMTSLNNRFPVTDNFIEEYAAFLKIMSGEILKEG
jgi:hypothetical protein